MKQPVTWQKIVGTILGGLIIAFVTLTITLIGVGLVRWAFNFATQTY